MPLINPAAAVVAQGDAAWPAAGAEANDQPPAPLGAFAFVGEDVLSKKGLLKPRPTGDVDKMTVAQAFGVPQNFDNTHKAASFLAGIECEIEAVPAGKAKHVGVLGVKEDGSLRNSGYEWVSPPQHREALVTGFINLQNYLGLDPAKDPFSERTSIHVHVNVASLTLRQAKNFLMLYALFEEPLFSMVKPERRANIHCVPLTETHLPTYYRRDIVGLKHVWSKYTALNICRLNDLGTFEFRHHHGTGDPEVLNIWLKVLDNMWTLSRQVVIDEASLSDPNRLYAWFSTIFQSSPRTLQLAPQLLNIIGNSLIDVKFSTIKE